MSDVAGKGFKKYICIGLLAHVDAGKTTLSESLLFENGAMRERGRVDKGNVFLDTYAVEKERGITVFSKQAVLKGEAADIILMDTPGHVDFSAEMERTLQILDGAVLVLSGVEGIQAHTRTLWKLLQKYDIPVMIFVNKTDRFENREEGAKLLAKLQEEFGDHCVDFSEEVKGTEPFYENIAVCEEAALDLYMETGSVPEEMTGKLIRERKLFPCYFGSALKGDGAGELLADMGRYLGRQEYPGEFGARVYKISRDEQGKRLTWLKVTGGKLAVRDLLSVETEDGTWEEKVSQIRLYSGAKYDVASEIGAGCVAAVTGPEHTFAGAGLGREQGILQPLLEPVLSYEMILEEGYDLVKALPLLRQLEEEEPELHFALDEEGKKLQLRLMGEIQLQILQRQIRERFGLEVSFGPGAIVYKETISKAVEGVGHFEPLRHYAEVHLLLEPGEPGSGMQYASGCSEDVLDGNWQRLVLTHLREREHRGVLTGGALTDMKVTLMSGKAHTKHTEGGDFRQATYRAVRQGLMQTESVLLEPYYDFCLEVPSALTGRAMTDLDMLDAKAFQPEMDGDMTQIRGSAPVVCLQSYQKEVAAYTKGLGRLSCTLKGYGPCHNTGEVLAEKAYDPERDVRNPSSSVFCAHGAGFVVPWDEVGEYMHLPSILTNEQEPTDGEIRRQAKAESRSAQALTIGTEEIDAILNKTAYANRKDAPISRKGIPARRRRQEKEGISIPSRARMYQPQEKKPEYLLVDGYNIIFAWKELKELAAVSLDGARGRLLDILCNYQGIRGCELIAVFDAYRLEGHVEEMVDYHNIHVVYTKEAETADRFIEKFAHEHASRYRISVATSDGLEQIIIRGAGCGLISARELEEEIHRANAHILQEYEEKQESGRVYLGDMDFNPFFPSQ